jgi:aspartate/methionine/tyrosine aminotransferase
MVENRFSPTLGRIAGTCTDVWALGDRATELMAQGRDVIHLGVGDPDMDVDPVIQAATVAAMAGGRTHYSPVDGEPALRAAIAAHAAGLYGGAVDPAEVAVCSGAQGALFSLFQVIAGAGDEVIVLSPYYTTYPAVVAACGASMVEVPLSVDEGYHLDLAAIAAALTPRTRAILINSPSNPSGRVIPAHEIEAIVALARAHDVWLVSDEVYWSLCYDAPHASVFARRHAHDKIAVINSLSKSHAMTGFRIGWIVGPPALVAAVGVLGQALHFSINQVAQDAATAALAHPAIADRIRARFGEQRDALVAGLGQIAGLRFSPPQGGMFLLVDVSATGLDGRQFASALLEQQGVATVPGYGFGHAATGMIRIGFLSRPARLTEAAERIARFTQALMAPARATAASAAH